MKLTHAVICLLSLAIVGNIMSCSSSNAQQDRITAEDVQAIVAEAVGPLNNEIADLEDKVATLEAQASKSPLFVAGAPNPVQIAAFYPVYFEGQNCQGQAYLHASGPNYDLSQAAIRAGIATRYTLGGQTDEAPETYTWVEPGSDFVTVPSESRLNGAGLCDNVSTPSIIGYAVQQQTDPEAYEALTGVPAGGFLEGTELASYTSMPEGGLIGGRFYDMVTSTGMYMRFDANSEPLVTRSGAQ